jgi:hypothetical protein
VICVTSGDTRLDAGAIVILAGLPAESLDIPGLQENRVGSIREAPPAKLFMAVMHRPDFDPEPLLGHLAERYGPVDARCVPYLFESSYYEAEMGRSISLFVSFDA